ncbi:MAG: hypothetical protein ACR2QG_10935 [Gammaproteobacteria bacterium]
MKNRAKNLLFTIALLFAALFAVPASAAKLEVWDLTSPLGEGGNAGGDGNFFEFDTTITDVGDLQVYAWSDEGAGTILSESEVFSDANGLGACNSQEFFLFAFLNCSVIDANWRAVDNAGERDWLLIYLPNVSGNEWRDITIAPKNDLDMDISYWIGTIDDPSDLNGVDTDDAGLGLSFGNRVDVDNDNTGGNITITFSDYDPAVFGNAILVGSSYNDVDLNDGFIATSVSALVPVPPAVWLFVSALGILFGRQRIRSTK